MIEQPPVTFRSSFAVAWRWTTTICGIVFGFGYVIAWFLSGRQPDAPPTIATAVVAGLLFAVAIIFWPVYVLSDGIRTYNYWGMYRTVPWTEFTVVERANIFGLRYLRFASIDGTRLYIPLWLADMPGFAAIVRDRAGDVHPLVFALERYRSFPNHR